MANAPASVTRADELRGNVVRLECPHELPEGDWDGPVYACLREPRHIQPGHASPFVIDDSSRRPGWVCDIISRRYNPNEPSGPSSEDIAAGLASVVIPYTRLSHPAEDLSRELRDRPLLLQFRFVRFRTCFLLDGGGSDTRRFVEVSQTVFLVGQVVAYRPCDRLSFVTPSGVTLRPTSNYMCVVAIRQPESNRPAHVLLPAQSAWDSLISRQEYVVGWCHGVPAGTYPTRRTARFRSRWDEFIVPDTDDAELQRLLRDAFVPSGSDTTVDFGTSSIQLITEFGRIISIVPLEYARTYIGPSRSTARVDETANSDSDSPDDILAVGMSRGRPRPHGIPRVMCLDSPQRLSLPVPDLWITPHGVEPDSNPQLQHFAATSTSAGTVAPQATAVPTGVEARTLSGVPLAPSAAVAVAPAVSDTIMITLMSLARSTQQMVETTQQLMREQREHQSLAAHQTIPNIARPSLNVDTTEVSAVMEGGPTSRSRLPSHRRSGSRDHHRYPRHSTSPTSRGRTRQPPGDRSRSPPPRTSRQRSRDQSRSPVRGGGRGTRTRSRSRTRNPPHDRISGRVASPWPHRERSPGYSPRDTGRDPRHPTFDEGPRRRYDGAFRADYRDSPQGLGGNYGTRFSVRESEARRQEGASPSPRQRRGWSVSPRHGQYPARDDRHGFPYTRDRDNAQMRDTDLLQHTISDLMAGATRFRPPAAELQVHQVANVGPRPNGTYNRANLQSFWNMSLLDRVSDIQQRETLRNRYRVTKVTAKMIFAVNFGTRQLDHFLPPLTQSGGGRSITHDPSTWTSADTSPSAYIQSIKDLRLTLSRIDEVAKEWYPRPVAEVFSSVHANSRSELLDQAPQNLVHATINLYTHVFTTLFHSIREGLPAASLLPQAQAIMTRGSAEYERLVRNVIDEGLIATWARNQSTRRSPRAERTSKSKTKRQPATEHTGSAIPQAIKSLIPVVNDRQVCLRFQTLKGCDFTGCKHSHELTKLPTEVFKHVTTKHGNLKDGHPNLAN